MKTLLLLLCLLSGLLAASPLVSAQTDNRRGQPFWYTVQQNGVVWQTRTASKPLKSGVVLANGSRLHPNSTEVLLASGEVEQLNPNDMVLPSGTIVRVAAADSISTADFTPPALPAGTGQLKGVVELGASGFNSFIIRTDGSGRWKLEKADYGNSLVYENLANPDDIRRGLKTYISQMLDFGVPGRDIHFIVSSGASLASGTKALTEALKQLGFVVNVVTSEQEGALALRATVPPAYAERAFVADIGSANTKLAWQAEGRAGTADTYGSKYYQQGLTDSAVAAGVQARAGLVPTNRRQTCFLIGGVPHELAKLGRRDQETFTVLKAADDYEQPEGNAKTRAGLVIYRALAQATGCQRFVFNWNANFAIGYLLALP